MTTTGQDDKRPRSRGRRGAGEGSISRHHTGAWRGRLMVGYRPDGSPDRREVYGKTRAEVQKKLAELRRQAEYGMLSSVPVDRQTVGAFLQAWQETIKSSVRPMTWRRYGQLTRIYLVPALGRHKLVALRPEHIQKLYSDQLAAGRAARTVRQIHAVLHRALAQAVRWGYLPRNVADIVDKPRAAPSDLRPPTPAEVRRLLETASAAGDGLAALYTVAVYTGCRQGELLALTWDDVNLDAGLLTIRRTLLKVVAGAVPLFGQPKTMRSRRTVNMAPETVRVLTEHMERQLADRQAVGSDYAPYNLVFCTHLGTPLRARNVVRSFKRALERAGLPESVRFHDLRHASATILRRARVDLKTVSERLGHSSIGVTADLYQHAVPELDEDAAARLERTIRGSDKHATDSAGEALPE